VSASPTKEDTLARETTEERFTELYRAHVDAVRAYAWRRGPAVADDVAVARNVRLNQHRGERRRSALAERLRLTAGPWPPPEEPDRQLAAALAELPELDREVLLLDAWDGLDNAAIAVALGCTRASVAVRKTRARRRLETLLADGRAAATVAALERTPDAC
jgi:RNA polymerase sigma-70 factor (ECF subfamily)